MATPFGRRAPTPHISRPKGPRARPARTDFQAKPLHPKSRRPRPIAVHRATEKAPPGAHNSKRPPCCPGPPLLDASAHRPTAPQPTISAAPELPPRSAHMPGPSKAQLRFGARPSRAALGSAVIQAPYPRPGKIPRADMTFCSLAGALPAAATRAKGALPRPASRPISGRQLARGQALKAPAAPGPAHQ